MYQKKLNLSYGKWLSKMRFKDYITEKVIIPDKLKITTSDVDKLNKQFKNYPVKFKFVEVDSDTEPSAGYIPKDNTIRVSINKDLPLKVIEALIQHEIIHYIQNQKSGNRMQADIERSAKLMKDIMDQVDDWEDDAENGPAAIAYLAKKYKELHTKAKYLNDEERQTYAYMFVKLRSSDNIKEVIKEANKMWLDLTNEKMNNKMLKYFYMYWQVKDQL